MVAEYYVSCKRKIVKFFRDIIIIYANMSNRYSVGITIALNSQVTLF